MTLRRRLGQTTALALFVVIGVACVAQAQKRSQVQAPADPPASVHSDADEPVEQDPDTEPVFLPSPKAAPEPFYSPGPKAAPTPVFSPGSKVDPGPVLVPESVFFSGSKTKPNPIVVPTPQQRVFLPGSKALSRPIILPEPQEEPDASPSATQAAPEPVFSSGSKVILGPALRPDGSYYSPEQVNKILESIKSDPPLIEDSAPESPATNEPEK